MDCFDRFSGRWETSKEGHILESHSALLALIDQSCVAEAVSFALAVRDDPNSHRDIPATGIVETPSGRVIPLITAGEFGFLTHVDGDHAPSVRLDFLEWDLQRDRWVPLGLMPVPSAKLVIGDPYLLEEFSPENTTGPYTVHPDRQWATFSLPGRGWVALHALKGDGEACGVNLSIRADWLP